MSYDNPGISGYGADLRENWLRMRFPETTIVVIDPSRLLTACRAACIEHIPELPLNTASDDDHRHFVAWFCNNILGQTVDAVFTSEVYGDGFAEVLERCFGHSVTHVCIDNLRRTVPISGRQIRSNPHAFRHFLSPEVYASFIRRIAILGGESTGKTTLAAALAEHLKTRWVPEYGRELWETKAGQLIYDDMLHIAVTQIDRELQFAKEANQWLVCDTTPLTTLFYCQEMFGRVPDNLHKLANRYYDLTLLCAPDFEFVQDGTRRDDSFRSIQHAWYVERLTGSCCAFSEVRGEMTQRVEEAIRVIETHDNDFRPTLSDQ